MLCCSGSTGAQNTQTASRENVLLSLFTLKWQLESSTRMKTEKKKGEETVVQGAGQQV